MRNSLLRLIGLTVAMIPMAITAQTNIKSAFEAIIKCPVAQITESHSLDKNPETNVKVGQSDVYNFVLPANKINLVRNVVSAFDKDVDMSYGIKRGSTSDKDPNINLAVGEGGEEAVHITDSNCDYAYALFLAPRAEDPEGNYRYAYGINYKEVDGKIKGKLVVTYATTLKYRQEMEKQSHYENLRNLSNGYVVVNTKGKTQDKWFTRVMTFVRSMSSANTQTRISLATKVYELIQESSTYSDVTEADKNAVREILKGMVMDKKYSETILNSLLNQCIAALK